MSLAQPAVSPRPVLAERLSRRFADTGVVLLACLVSFVMSWPHLAVVWRTGTFFDTDDAMRMVEVRDWLSGQGWYDLVAHRLSPPAGVLMHWSRIVDVPLGLLVRGFGLFAAPGSAERLARITFPLSCQVLLILAFLRVARALCGKRVFLPALMVVILSGFQFGQFVAGRIDHHAPQIVLLVTFVGAAVSGLRGAGRGAGAICAAAMAISLGISLENLPFVAVVGGGIALGWVMRGEATASFTCTFGWMLALSIVLVAAATVPPARWTVVSNDALSAPHILLAILAGSGLALASGRVRDTGSKLRRGLAACTAGAVAAVSVLFLCHGFPASPYAGVDATVRTLWLEHVTEAMPLFESMRLHPAVASIVALPLGAGLLASFFACAVAKGSERDAWLLVAACVAVGVAGTCWEVRVSTSAMPLAGLGGVWVLLRAARRSKPGFWHSPMLRCTLVAIPFCPVLCAFLPVPDEAPSVNEATIAAQGCREASALAPLASLPPGLAFAPIDLGSHLLAHTGLSVLAAPYHRNNAGNHAVLDGFMLPPEEARARVEATQATYLVVCRGEMQLGVMARNAPAGLAAHLQAGDVPDWLQAIPLGSTPYRAYRVQ